MSILKLPDPHPGRCINLRPADDQYGYPTYLRCLEAEGTTHVCRFPDPPERIKNNDVYHTYSLDEISKPTPWVVPK